MYNKKQKLLFSIFLVIGGLFILIATAFDHAACYYTTDIFLQYRMCETEEALYKISQLELVLIVLGSFCVMTGSISYKSIRKKYHTFPYSRPYTKIF
jgi:hypothetical protein